MGEEVGVVGEGPAVWDLGYLYFSVDRHVEDPLEWLFPEVLNVVASMDGLVASRGWAQGAGRSLWICEKRQTPARLRIFSAGRAE